MVRLLPRIHLGMDASANATDANGKPLQDCEWELVDWIGSQPLFWIMLGWCHGQKSHHILLVYNLSCLRIRTCHSAIFIQRILTCANFGRAYTCLVLWGYVIYGDSHSELPHLTFRVIWVFAFRIHDASIFENAVLGSRKASKWKWGLPAFSRVAWGCANNNHHMDGRQGNMCICQWRCVCVIICVSCMPLHTSYVLIDCI